MSFEMIERVGISTESISHAINAVVSEAHAEKPIYWFEVVEQRGRVLQNGNLEYQVKVKMGRKLS